MLPEEVIDARDRCEFAKNWLTEFINDHLNGYCGVDWDEGPLVDALDDIYCIERFLNRAIDKAKKGGE